jgi:hypothetical protein
MTLRLQIICTKYTIPTDPTRATKTYKLSHAHIHMHTHTHTHTYTRTPSPQPPPVPSLSPISVALPRAGNGGAPLLTASPHCCRSITTFTLPSISCLHSFNTFITSCLYQPHTLHHHQTIRLSTSTDHTVITSYLGSETASLHCTAMMTGTPFYS